MIHRYKSKITDVALLISIYLNALLKKEIFLSRLVAKCFVIGKPFGVNNAREKQI